MNVHVLERVTRHSVYTQRFAGHLSNLFDPYLEQLRKEITVILLSGPDKSQNMRVINRLIAEYRNASSAIYGEYYSDVLLSELEEFGVHEADWEAAMLKKVTKPGTPIKAPALAQVWAGVTSQPLVFPDGAGVKMLEPFIKDWHAGQIKKVSDTIRTGYITGKTNQQIVREIAGHNGMLDVTSRKSIKAMVRTSTNHVANVARGRTLNENKTILDGYEIVSTLDGRTSNFCRGADGSKVYFKGLIIWGNGRKEETTRKPKPPFHPNCRTTFVPLIKKKFDILGGVSTRASKGVNGGKQISGDNLYYDFLKTQGAQGPKGRAFVEDVLGKQRAGLFLDGGLSVTKFKQLTMDDLFQPLPLKELRNKKSLETAFDLIE